MKQWTCWSVFCAILLGWTGVVSADYVKDMMKTVRTHEDYKVRMTALVALSNYENPEIASLLADILQNVQEHPSVRGMAARLLAKMYVVSAIPIFRKLSQTQNRRLRESLEEAMSKLCPRDIKGKKFYVNFEHAKGEGPHHQYAVELAVMEFAKFLATKRSDVLLGWMRCQKPNQRMLRRYKITGYFIHIKVQLKVEENGGTYGNINLLYTMYPKNSIRGMTSMEARTPVKPDVSVISFMIKSLVQGLSSSVDEFLKPL